MKSAHVTLQAIEIGNEADLYKNNGLRSSSYSISDYVPQCVLETTVLPSLSDTLKVDHICHECHQNGQRVAREGRRLTRHRVRREFSHIVWLLTGSRLRPRHPGLGRWVAGQVVRFFSSFALH